MTDVHLIDAPSLDGDLETLIFVGRAHRLAADDVVSALPAALSPATWSRMLEGTDAGEHGRVATTWLTDGPARVVAAVLPEAVSRHNSPTRAWAVRHVVASAASKKRTAIVLCVDDAAHGPAAAMAAARAFPRYSSKKRAQRTVTVAALAPEGAVALSGVQPAVDGVRAAAELVDRPPNDLTTSAFVEAAEAVAQRTGASLRVVRGTELAEQGLNGIWGVGKAAADPPAMVVLDHGGTEGGACWVGKGIVYDTGGLSLKTKTGMPGMKTDMGGAAAVLSAFEAAVSMGHAGPLTAVLCIAENAIGRDATRPDDVLHMYSGRTVEVNNTDAEGRLVLADGVAWVAKHRAPAVVVDMATLTGAQSVSTGKLHAALYCSDDDLESRAVAIGRTTGDLAHPLPFAPELFRKEFASSIADMKNSVKNRSNAQSSCAGQFVGNHLRAAGYEGPWLHIDMAGPSTHAGRGTGWGVGMLLGLIGRL